MSAQLGSLVVEISANIAKFQGDMGRVASIAERNAQQVQKAFDVVGTSLKALGAGFAIGLTIDKVKDQIEGAIKSAAGLQGLAERTGATVEGLSGLASVARLSGTDTESLATGLQKLSKSMVDASNGGKATTAAFNAIGISTKDVISLSPDKAFELIALRLAKYADGAGKTAAAQALLGKSGANLLPVLKDLADVGELQTKYTTAQAQQADEYNKTLVRLNAAQSLVYKQVAIELLPVMSAFAETLLESAKQGNGLGKSIDGLAKDGSLRSWAEGVAIAVGTAVEAVLGLIKLARAVGGSFQAVAADIELPFKIGAALTSGGSVGARLAAVGQAVKERNQVVADANARYDELWNGNLTTFTDGLKKRFAAQRAAEAAVTAGGGAGAADPKPQVNLKTGDSVGAADSFLEGLKRQVEEQQRGRFEMLRFQAAQKNVSGEAESYIEFLEQADLIQRRIKRTVEEVAKAEEQRSKVSGLVSGGNDLAKGLNQETAAIGLNAVAQRRLTELRKLDELVQRAQVDATSETRAEIEVLAGVLRENLVSALDRAEQAEKDLSGSFSTGAKTAFEDYVTNAYNSNKFAQNLITGGLQKMEDAILNFAKTGKLSFADLFSFMAEEYLRQSIRMSIADFLPGGNGSGGTSLLATAVSFFGHANGLSYVPYDNYPAMLHEGERVITKAEAGGGHSGGLLVDQSGQTINVGAGVSLAQVNAAINQSAARNRESILRSLRQQGVAA